MNASGRVALLATLALSCAPPPPARPAPLREVCAEPPSCPSWVDALRDVTLRVWVVDQVSPNCQDGTEIRVTVGLDGHAVGYVDVPCAKTPGKPLVVSGPTVEPGLHEIGVHANLPTGGFEVATIVSLPAFQPSRDDKQAIVGAEIVAELRSNEIRVQPPLPYPPTQPGK